MICTISRDAEPVFCKMPRRDVEEREDQRGDGDTDRAVAPEQGHGDAGESEVLDRVGREQSAVHDLGHADESGDALRTAASRS